MIAEGIGRQVQEAMKDKDEVRVSTLKMLSSELHNAKIQKMGDLSEEEELEVVRKEAKKRKDAIEAYEKAGQKERAEKEKKELEILQEFLPEQMSDEDIKKHVESAIEETGASDISDMGQVMGKVMPKVKGKADGNRVSKVVKQKLTG